MANARFTLIQNGEVYTPRPIGHQSILIDGGVIARIGPVDVAAVNRVGLGLEIIDASGCLVLPGFVDPHEHLIGGGGESGFASRLPEVQVDQLVESGITTVVGCLGTDTSTRHLTTLFAKTRQLAAQGVTALMFTGGFPVPPPTLTSSIRSDLILIEPVIGVGEIAIADRRSVEPSAREVAHLVSDAYDGGTLAGKSGVTHFHVGEGKRRLALLRELLDDYEIPPAQVYPAHVGRSSDLLREAIDLAARGSFVDIDTVDGGLGQRLTYFWDNGGDPAKLTVSSDAHTEGGSPRVYFESFVACLREFGLPIERVLPAFTENPANALQLSGKGRLQENLDADVLILRQESLAIAHVVARGRSLVRDGRRTA